MDVPHAGDDWVALTADPIPLAEIAAWVVRSDCGAVVTFTGHARDHSPGRPGVEELTYEAYDEQVEPVLRRVCREVRVQWPDVGRIALVHRQGELGLGDVAVAVAVSTPHRESAFQAARYAIDTVKAEAPIWKRERWVGGESWGLESELAEVDAS